MCKRANSSLLTQSLYCILCDMCVCVRVCNNDNFFTRAFRGKLIIIETLLY